MSLIDEPYAKCARCDCDMLIGMSQASYLNKFTFCKGCFLRNDHNDFLKTLPVTEADKANYQEQSDSILSALMAAQAVPFDGPPTSFVILDEDPEKFWADARAARDGCGNYVFAEESNP